MAEKNQFLDPQMFQHNITLNQNNISAQMLKNKSKSSFKLQKITQQITKNPFSPAKHQKRLQNIGKYIVQNRNTPRPQSDTGSVKNLGSVRGSIHSDIYGKLGNRILQSKMGKQKTILTQGSQAQKKKLNLYIVGQYKKQKLVRDFEKNPSKYKIVAQHLGLSPVQTYQLNNAQINRIQEQYKKKKGIQYLRQANSVDRYRFKTSPSHKNMKQIRINKTSQKSHSYIHQIFGHLAKPKKSKSLKLVNIQTSIKKNKLQQIYEKQQMLGKLVFQRAKKHLKQKSEGKDFFKRVYTQEAVDDALINFVKTKIKRVEMCLGH